MELLSTLLFVAIVATGILLAILVCLSNKKSAISWWFAAVTLAILLWNTFGFFAYRASINYNSLIFFRLNFAAVALFFIAVYFFSIYFPIENKKRSPLLDWTVIATSSIFSILSITTDTIISGAEIVNGGNRLVMKTGMFGSIFYIYCIILTLYILFLIIRKYFLLDKANKLKMKFFLIGILAFAILNLIFSILISYIFPENYKITQLGDFSAIIFIIFTAYAIVKHQLFNIKLITTETIVIALSLALLIEVFISENIVDYIVKGIIWLLATYGGYQLIKSVKREIRQREQIQKLADELKHANEHLKDLDKLKDDFISMAAHELNTPVAAIEGYLSMILEERMGGEINPELKKWLETIFESSKRLALMIHDMLNVSRIESGRVHLVYTQNQIEDVIEEAIKEMMSKAKEKNHTLSYSRPKIALAKTWFDITRINEVLVNLIGNAIKYTEPAGKIEVGANSNDKNITVSIKDNGRGISEEKKSIVFDKFGQLDILKDENKGTGLGMYISKNFIELHKGKIWFESKGVGKGSTFYFSLPIIKEKPFDPHEGEGEVLH